MIQFKTEVGIISSKMLHNIKYLLSGKQSVFVNVGRANVISDEALLKALDNKWISTGILDVFHEEPVPKVCINYDY